MNAAETVLLAREDIETKACDRIAAALRCVSRDQHAIYRDAFALAEWFLVRDLCCERESLDACGVLTTATRKHFGGVV